MVDTKFLIVTTLCYVGILIVVLAVCCCAWARYIKNEGKMPPNRRTKQQASRGGSRRVVREFEPSDHCAPTLPSRQYLYIGDFTDLNYTHQPTATYPHLQHNFRSANMPRPSFSSNHYTLVSDGAYPPRNYYPASLATATDTYDMDLRMDIGSTAYGDTSQGGFSGDEFSDFQSSRYDSGPDVSGIISGEGVALSCSGNSLTKVANNISADTNESGRAVNISRHDEYSRRITVDVQGSEQSDSDFPLAVQCCNGVGITPSPSAQSLSEFNDQPDEIPLNGN